MQKLHIIVFILILVAGLPLTGAVTPEDVIYERALISHFGMSYTIRIEVTNPRYDGGVYGNFLNFSEELYPSEIYNITLNYNIISNRSVEVVGSIIIDIKPPKSSAKYDPSLIGSINSPEVLELPEEAKEVVRLIANNSGTYYELILRLNEFVSDYMIYDITYGTMEKYYLRNVSEIWETRRGVCKDYAKLLVAMLNYAGVKTAYVVGYLWDGDVLAVHEWVLAYDPENGWIPVDPTNDVNGMWFDGWLYPFLFPIQESKVYTPFLYLPFPVNPNDIKETVVFNSIQMQKWVATKGFVIEKERTPGIISGEDSGVVIYFPIKGTIFESLSRYVGDDFYMPYYFESNESVLVELDQFSGMKVPRMFTENLTVETSHSVIVTFSNATRTLTFQGVGEELYLVYNGKKLRGVFDPVSSTATFLLTGVNFTLSGDEIKIDTYKIPVTSTTNQNISVQYLFGYRVVDGYIYVLKVSGDVQELINSLSTYGFQLVKQKKDLIFVKHTQPAVILNINGEEMRISVNDLSTYTIKPMKVSGELKQGHVEVTMVFNTQLPISRYDLVTVPLIVNGGERHILFDGEINGDTMKIKIPLYPQDVKNDIKLNFFGVYDLRDYASLKIDEYSVDGVTFNSLYGDGFKFTIRFKAKLNNTVGTDVLKYYVPELNIISLEGDELVAEIPAFISRNDIKYGAKLTAEILGNVIEADLTPFEYFSFVPDSITVSLEKVYGNTYELRVTKRFAVNTDEDIMLLSMYYNTENTVEINGEKYPATSKEMNQNMIEYIVSIPVDKLWGGISVDGKDATVLVTYDVNPSIFSPSIKINAPLIKSALTCNKEYATVLVDDGFIVKVQIKSVYETVSCTYFDANITFEPKAPATYQVVFEDKDSIDDIKNKTAIYSEYTSVFVKVVVIGEAFPYNVLVDGKKIGSGVGNGEFKMIEGLREGKHKIEIVDTSTGVVVFREEFFVEKQTLMLFLLHNIYIVIGAVLIGSIVIGYLITHSTFSLVNDVTEKIRRRYPHAEFYRIVKKPRYNALYFIDRSIKAVIVVYTDKKGRILQIVEHNI